MAFKKGHIVNKEIRKKISQKLLGIKRSEETRKKMSEKNWLKGKHIQVNNALGIWRKNGGITWCKGTKGIVKAWNKGIPHSKETIEKLKKSRKRIPIRNWKGDKVGYSGLHKWIVKILGKPQECEMCGKAGLTGRQIHWANIGHLYKRNLTDWIRLCAKCHKEYDDLNNLSHKWEK